MLHAFTADSANSRSSIKMPWAPLTVKRKGKYALKRWIMFSESCSNFFWHISLISDLLRPVLASHPSMANPICCAYSSQPCFLSCPLSSASAQCAGREVSRSAYFDVFLRKKSASRKHPVFFIQTDRAKHRRVWHLNTGVPTGRLLWWGATHDTLIPDSKHKTVSANSSVTPYS